MEKGKLTLRYEKTRCVEMTMDGVDLLNLLPIMGARIVMTRREIPVLSLDVMVTEMDAKFSEAVLCGLQGNADD